MFAFLGRLVYRFRWAVVLFWIALLVLGSIFAPRLGSVLKSGFGEEETEAQIGLRLLESELKQKPAYLTVVFSSDSLTVDDPRFLAAMRSSLANLEGMEGIDEATTFYDSGRPSLVSPDRKTTYALLTSNLGIDELVELVPEARQRVRSQELDVWVTGSAAIFADIQRIGEADLRKAEAFSFPLILVALLLVFGTVVAAGLPVLMGGVGLVITLGIMYFVGRATDMSIFAQNTASLLGIGIAVDYSLLMVSRFREELGVGGVEEGVVKTVSTAGKALFFSGLTTVLGLAGLFFFKFMMLRTIGLGGMIVVFVSIFMGLTLLPAALALLGARINTLPIIPQGRGGGGFWRRVASWVMRYPLLVTIPIVLFLVILGLPFLRANLGTAWMSVLPKSAESREGWDVVSQRFGEGTLSPILVMATSEEGILSTRSVDTLYDFTREIEKLPGVNKVESIVNLSPEITKEQYQLLYSRPSQIPFPQVREVLRESTSERATAIQIYTSYSITSEEAKALVKKIRELRPKDVLQVYVTGSTASLMDIVTSLYSDFPKVLVFVVLSIYIVLLVLFRSVILPLKAVIMNTLSILASYGALVFIFQEGHFQGLLNFTATGIVEASLPILMFCILFGLSMDYEVFLLTRVKEHYDQSRDNTESVALGLERTGRVITSAALIMVLVSASFSIGDIIYIKALGVGIALAIFLDSTIIRVLLVPALMRILGDLNWWAPGFLKRVLSERGGY